MSVDWTVLLVTAVIPSALRFLSIGVQAYTFAVLFVPCDFFAGNYNAAECTYVFTS